MSKTLSKEQEFIIIFCIFTAPLFSCPSGVEQGLYSDSTDCSYFYVCAGQIYFRMKCPDSLYFNNITKQCDFSYNINCSFVTTRITGTQKPTTISTLLTGTQKPVTSSPVTTTTTIVTSPLTIQAYSWNM